MDGGGSECLVERSTPRGKKNFNLRSLQPIREISEEGTTAGQTADAKFRGSRGAKPKERG